jgi:protein-tyrosine phosphatase
LDSVIDLHCHLLPGIDDGAVDMADSLALARQGQDDGVRAICATPHIRHDHDVRIHELPERLAQLQWALDEAGVQVRALLGGEVAETALAGLDDDELRGVSLGGGGRWILLEPAPGPLTASLEDAVHELERRGFDSVIAHPERHAFGEDFFDRVRGLVGAGALIQATAAAILDEHSGPTLLGMAADGLVHVLGSDAHSARFGRPVALRAAIVALERVPELHPHLDWIERHAPEAIIAGEPLRTPFPD